MATDNSSGRFRKPIDISKMTGVTVAKVVEWGFVNGRWAKQLELKFLTVKGTMITGWFTLESHQQIQMLIDAAILHEDEEGFCQVIDMEEQKNVQLKVEEGKIKEIKKYTATQPPSK